MNTAIKRDGTGLEPFAGSTNNGLQWANNNRRTALLIGAIGLLLIVALVGGYTIYQHRVAQAQTAFGAAMQTYQTPLLRPDQPLPPGIKPFNSAKERADKANAQFAQVASQFGMTQPGKLAHYFVGLTAMDAGNNGSAEDTLKSVASGWNGDTAALAKMSLAQLYEQTGRGDQAVAIYEGLAKGHAATVPPSLAQLQLAALYSSEGKTEDARRVYAEVKDHDKDAQGKPGVAAQVATEKLNPKPAGPPTR